MSDTVFSFKIKCGTHIEDCTLSREICGEYPTTDTLAQLIAQRTGFPIHIQKLIVAGRLIRPGDMLIRESLHQFSGRTIILLGCTSVTLERMRQQREDADYRQRACLQRRQMTLESFASCAAKMEAIAHLHLGRPVIDNITQCRIGESADLRTHGRRFGLYVQDPIPNDRDAIAELFGIGVVPAWSCDHRSAQHTGCIDCCDRFLAEWFVFTHLHLTRRCVIRQLEHNTNPNSYTKSGWDGNLERLERIQLSWELEQPDLKVLLSEIQQLDEDLAFPDFEQEHRILSSDAEMVIRDYESLQIAIDLLEVELGFDESDMEEGEVRPRRFFGADR